MIPYYGTHGSRERIHNKSIQEEYEIWVLVAEAYGYVIQFRQYQGAKKRKQVASSTKWRLGEDIVLGLIEYLTPITSFDIFMGNDFTSFCLLTYVGINNIRVTGVLNKNRLRKYTIIGDQQLQKKERGHFRQRFSSKKAV